jgi:hypothetical protein
VDLLILREEFDLALRYTQSLYEDLSDAEVQWRAAPHSSGIAWHLGHQAAVNHYLMRNLINAEASLNPQFDALFDSANPEEHRGNTPSLAEIVAYRHAIATRTYRHIDTILAGDQPAAHEAAQHVTRIIEPILISMINHEYQHDCWVREMRATLGRDKPDTILSNRVRQVDGYWGLGLA